MNKLQQKLGIPLTSLVGKDELQTQRSASNNTELFDTIKWQVLDHTLY